MRDGVRREPFRVMDRVRVRVRVRDWRVGACMHTWPVIVVLGANASTESTERTIHNRVHARIRTGDSHDFPRGGR